MFKGHPVGDGALGCGGMEPVGMSDDPVRHKSAVGTSGNTETGCAAGCRCFSAGKKRKVTELVVFNLRLKKLQTSLQLLNITV